MSSPYPGLLHLRQEAEAIAKARIIQLHREGKLEGWLLEHTHGMARHGADNRAGEMPATPD